jgi:prevent-host-death family protein
MKEMPAGQFKSQCLAIMDQVQESGEPVLITKRGKPVAKLVPVKKTGDDIFGYMVGKARITGDIINSIPPEDWESK